MPGSNHQAFLDFLEKRRTEAIDLGEAGEMQAGLDLLTEIETEHKEQLSAAQLGRIWRTKSNLFYDFDRFQEAIDAAQKSAAYYREEHDMLEIAKSRAVEIAAYGYLGNVPTARTVFNELRPILSEFPTFTLVIMYNLAATLTYNWLNEEALEINLKIQALARQEAWDDLVDDTEHDLGLIYEQMGNYQKAVPIYEKAVANLTDHDEPIDHLIRRFNLARVNIKLGRYEAGLKTLAEARQTTAFQLDTINKGFVLLYEGWVRMLLGEPALAIELLSAAQSVLTRFDQRKAAAEASLLLGQLFGSVNSRTSEMQGLKLLAGAAAAFEEDQYAAQRARVLRSQADILARQGNFGYALDRATAAHRLCADKEMPLQTAETAVLIGDILLKGKLGLASAKEWLTAGMQQAEILPPASRIRGYAGLGQIAAASDHIQQGDHLVQARSLLETALAEAEERMEHLSRYEHQAWLTQRIDEIGQHLLSVLHQLSPSAEVNQAIWQTLSRVTAGGLAKQLGRRQLSQKPTVPADLLTKREMQRRRLEQLYGHEPGNPTAESIHPDAQKVKQESQIQEIVAAKHALKQIDEKISREIASRAKERGEAQSAQNIDETEPVRPPAQSAIIQFYEVDQQVWVLSMMADGKINRLRLNITRQKLDQRWRQTARRLQPKYAAKSVDPQLNGRLEQLYTDLIAPIEPMLMANGNQADITNLIIVPFGPLWEIPFAILIDPQTGCCLAERYGVTTTPSYRNAAYAQKAEGSPFLLGYAGQPSAADYLPHVDREVEACKTILEGEAVAVTDLHGEGATIDRFFAILEQQAVAPQILHIAAHIEYDASDPLNSGIRLAQNQRLTASDLFIRPDMLAGSLVVLNGCRSGRVKPTGTEILGLNSGMLFAGARGILSTLWPVSDEASLRFVELFYPALARHSGDPAAALADTQQRLRADQRFSHPFYWGAYIYTDHNG
ncbi:MAG: CHAT domain-containing tetratricopeptide repeat protein [Chloroflexota bacterium]